MTIYYTIVQIFMFLNGPMLSKQDGHTGKTRLYNKTILKSKVYLELYKLLSI